MANKGKGPNTNSPIQPLRETWWVRFVGYLKRKMHERTTKKQNETPADKVARITAKATVWMAVFTFVLAFTSIATVGILKNQLRDSYRDLRPYIQITKLDYVGDVFKGEMVKGKASIINSGKTPAVNVNGCADIVLKPNGDPMTDDFPCPAPNNPKRRDTEERSRFALGSGATGFTVDSPGTSIVPSNIPVESFKQLLSSGAFRIYFYGYIEYTDLTDIETIHHTTFCGRYNVYTGSLDICEKHNKMD